MTTEVHEDPVKASALGWLRAIGSRLEAPMAARQREEDISGFRWFAQQRLGVGSDSATVDSTSVEARVTLLVSHLRGEFLTFARSLCAQDPEAAAQDALLRLELELRKQKEIRNLVAFGKVIIRNRWLDEKRRGRHAETWRSALQNVAREDRAPSGDADPTRATELLGVLQRRLTPDQWETLSVHMDEPDDKLAAIKLGISAQAYRTRLSRSRAAARRLIDDSPPTSNDNTGPF